MSRHQAGISRETAAEYGRRAVQITELGEYVSPSGRVVRIAQMLKHAVEGTVSYPPDIPLEKSVRGQHQTRVTFENITTLEGARTLISQGCHPVVLNFASATHPGGGFLAGARAQEEYLARSSGLYACIRNNAMYAYHRSRRDPLYTNYAIYSPEVPVFRSDDGSLLEEPYTVGMITSPAVNASLIGRERRDEIAPAMWQRILKVLSIGLRHEHDAIVLGAWGCGAFGNDSREVASLFHSALEDDFRGAYRYVLFAVVDWTRDQRFIGPFQAAFQSPVSSSK